MNPEIMSKPSAIALLCLAVVLLVFVPVAMYLIFFMLGVNL